MKWLLKLGLKFVSYETIVGVMASGIAYIMEYARRKASKDGWEKAKSAMKKVKVWVNLFDEVYEDDTLTEDEEKKIEDAIKQGTLAESIYNIVKNRKSPGKEKSPRKGRSSTTNSESKPKKRGKNSK